MNAMETTPDLSPQTFSRISQFISDELGFKMPPAKKTMLQGRLMKRMRKLKLQSYESYCNYLFSEEGRQHEMVHMLDAVTTNKTDFFREPRHFEFLTRQVLPELARSEGAGVQRRLNVWSAGCSTGAEPYTLAMVLGEFSAAYAGFDYAILATDISTRVLSIAREAIYTETEAKPIPLALKKKYLLRSKDRTRQLVRIDPKLRKKVSFGRLNFMDAQYGIKTAMDMIFCRNVLIYFDHPTQQQVLSRLCRHLRPGGYLFSGHSETLNGFDLPLHQVDTTVYCRTR